MQMFRQAMAGMILGACAAAQAQSVVNQQTAKTVETRPAKSKTQEQMLLEQLNEKFQKLDELGQKLDNLQHRYDDIEKRLTVRDAELQQTRKDLDGAKSAAVEASKVTDVLGEGGSTVKQMQQDVTDLKATSAALTVKVENTQEQATKLEHPETLHFRGVDLTPGGYIAGETVNRQRAIGGDINTHFNGIPFAGQSAGVLSEFNGSGRQSRISLLIEGDLLSARLRGYVEADFLAAGTTSNDNQSNSYPLRLRQAWGQAVFNNGWTLTGGQMWSLATEYRHGLSNLDEAIPLTIDPQYNVGFTWERQYAFRVVKRIGSRMWFGGSAEQAQTLNIGGRNLPTLLYQQTGNAGGLYSPTSNYSMNLAPDLIAKLAFEPSWAHFEVFGVGRFFRARVFPNGPVPTGAQQSTSTSAQGAFTVKTEGGGAGLNIRTFLFRKRLEVAAHTLIGNGIGRYGTSGLPDATAHPNGSLALLTGGSALGSAEWHVRPRLDLYAYYGGEYAKRAWYATQYTNTTVGPTLGQPILAGYGAPTNDVSGCYVEVLPVSSSNGGGNVPGTAKNCDADTRNLQEGTFGYWFRFYKGTRGTLQQGVQYSYAVRHTWQGVGDINNNLPNSPKAIDNMWFTSFRYYLP